MSEEKAEYNTRTITRGFFSRLMRWGICHKTTYLDPDGDIIVVYLWPNGTMELEIQR